jgi:hypothetical protein
MGLGGMGMEAEQRSISERFGWDRAPEEEEWEEMVPVLAPGIQMLAQVNGTWDLVAAIKDQRPYKVKTYESGGLRRGIDLAKGQCSEENPTLWALSTATRRFKIASTLLAETLMQINLQGKDLARGLKETWQVVGESQTIQITYCDPHVLITRQMGDYRGGDLYLLWKRKIGPKWIKY